ncbi:UNVERIFIED_CONTAM: hypothetical protein GTU68_055846 [Idotea baltica]|nr:hypothetical protein [Idotea baltica]
MEKLIVHGGNPLSGTVNISGSKNASLPILAATLLTRGECIIRRVPDVSDTNYMLQILQNLGADVAPYDLVRKMRASVCVMGPLLARHNRCDVSLPGGCVIGDRPIDLHIKGFEDRIEAGTFMVAGALASEKALTVNRVVPAHLESVTQVLRDSGYQIDETEESLTVHRNSNGTGATIVTSPYPGFATDMQAQMSALFATTKGESKVTDTIFPQRFMHLSEMKRMGADVEVDDGTAVIRGVEQLSGAPVMASDLRASAALVLAGLNATGSTDIHRVYHIDRGYEGIDEKFRAVGARIDRVRE